MQLLPSMARERRMNVLFPIPLELMAPYMDEESGKNEYKKPEKRNKQIDDFYTPKVIFSGAPPEYFHTEEPPSLIQRLTLLLKRAQPRHPSRDNKSEDEVYPLISTSTAPKDNLPPIPPPPPRPVPPPIPPHPNMPPLPPHPNLPPIPNRPTSPYRSQSVPKSVARNLEKDDK